MKILLLSHSPKINTAQSRIGRELCSFIKEQNDNTYMFCNYHDVNFFPSKDEKYTHDNFEFFPATSADNYLKEYHDLVYKIKPDVVLLIGSYRDIKPIIQSKFKSNHNYKFGFWNIFSEDKIFIRNNHKIISECDFVFSFNKETEYYSEVCPSVFGIGNFIISTNSIKKKEVNKNKKITIGTIGKNMSSSDLGSFFALSNLLKKNNPDKFDFKLITNKYDFGDNSLIDINSYYNNSVNIYDDKFTSTKDSIDDDCLSYFYSSLDFIVDCSCSFNCGTTNMEAIKCGAIPLLINNPINNEIIKYFNIGIILPSQSRIISNNKLNFLDIYKSSSEIEKYISLNEKEENIEKIRYQILAKLSNLSRESHFNKIFSEIKNIYNSPVRLKLQSLV